MQKQPGTNSAKMRPSKTPTGSEKLARTIIAIRQNAAYRIGEYILFGQKIDMIIKHFMRHYFTTVNRASGLNRFTLHHSLK